MADKVKLTPPMTDSKTLDWAETEAKNLWADLGFVNDRLNQTPAISQALLSAYERGRAEREWQPIETAPKDGTKVDLWVIFKEAGPRRFPDAHWNDKLGGWQLGEYNALDYMTPPTITHWKPLPAPPAIRQLLEVK
jgi:hypothetical protein